MMFTIKIFDLNAEVFAKKTIMTLVFKINNSNIYMVMTLINQDITMLL